MLDVVWWGGDHMSGSALDDVSDNNGEISI
jgi:hypothetical protein